MKPVRLRFETEPRAIGDCLMGHRRGPVAWMGAALLAGATAAVLAASWQVIAARQELAAVQVQLQALGRRAPAATTPSPPLKAEERRAWNEVVRQLNTPWSALLASLEAATPEDVALVSIEPDAKQARVRLQAEAKTLDALLVYAQALQSAGPFAEVALVKHETNEQDPSRPVRLTLSIRLREVRAGDAEKGDTR